MSKLPKSPKKRKNKENASIANGAKGAESAKSAKSAKSANSISPDNPDNIGMHYDNEVLDFSQRLVNFLKEQYGMGAGELSSLGKGIERHSEDIKDFSGKLVHFLGAEYGGIDEVKSLISKIERRIRQEIRIPVSVFSNEELSILEGVCSYLKEEVGLSFHQIALLLNRNDRTIWATYNNSLRKIKRAAKEEKKAKEAEGQKGQRAKKPKAKEKKAQKAKEAKAEGIEEIKRIKEEKAGEAEEAGDIKGKEIRGIKELEISIPLSLLKDRKLTAFEWIVLYLKDEYKLNYHNIGILLKRDERNVWATYQRAGKKSRKSRSSNQDFRRVK